MHRTTTAPSPINLITTWFFYLVDLCRSRVKKKKRPSLIHMMSTLGGQQLSPRSKAGAKWLSKVKKGSAVAPKDSIAALSVMQLRSPLGSQMSFALQTTRIEHVADWETISRKYRALVGHVDEVKDLGSTEARDSDDGEGSGSQVPNNIASQPSSTVN